jgi:hypothetical protein
MKTLFVTLILLSGLAKAHVVPMAIQKAMEQVHAMAAYRKFDARMFKYAYLKEGLCDTCAQEQVEQQLKQLETDMGADFPRWLATYQDHLSEIRYAQALTPLKDVFSLMMARSSRDTLQRRFFITCVDFIKAVGALSMHNGMKSKDVRLLWLMDKAGFKKMCPVVNGQQPAAPRPFIHTLLTFRSHGDWYLLNSENPNPEIYYLGKSLPQRLGKDFSLPSVKNGMILTVAQVTELNIIFRGFPGQWLPNVTASGKLSEDQEDFVCK